MTQPVFAGVILPHDIQITENSSTSLSATFDVSAVTVQNTGPDRWTLTFPESVIFGVFTLGGWAEPEDTDTTNIVTTNLDNTETNQLFVFSDVAQLPG